MTISALTSGGCVPTKLITSTPPMLKPPATTLVRSGVKPPTFACFLIQSRHAASQVPSEDNAHTVVARKKALTTKSFVLISGRMSFVRSATTQMYPLSATACSSGV